MTMKYLFFSLVLCGKALVPITQGSDTAVSTLNYFVFPSGQTDNRIANYGWMQAGFGLQDSTTGVLFDSVFPVSGNIQLNGGTLTLNRDLQFNNSATIQGLGTIVGNDHVFQLSQSIVTLPSNTNIIKDTKIVLNNDVTISSAITLSGSCLINGNGHRLILGSGALYVNGTLMLQNVIVQGLAGTNIQCLGDNSLIILDGTTFILTSNFKFLKGYFQCRNAVVFKGHNTTFAYQTAAQSLIGSNSSLLLDSGFTFSYDQTRSNSSSLLEFVDKSSQLILNGAQLHTTTTELVLTKGSLLVKGDSIFSSEMQHGSPVVYKGITLGDGVSAANDFACDITTGAKLQILVGSLNYKNVGQSWLMENSVSQLYMGPNTTIRLYNSLNLGIGLALCDVNAVIARVSNAQLIGSVAAVGNLFFEQL